MQTIIVSNLDVNFHCSIYSEMGCSITPKYPLKIRKEIGNNYDIADSYINIGSVYNHKGNYTEALKNYYEALSISQKINNKQNIGILYNNIGKINETQGEYIQALKNQLASLKTREEISDKNGMASSNIAIGRVYSGMNNYKDAIKYETNGLALAKELGARDLIKDAYQNLALINAHNNNYKSAYENHVLFKQTNDSIFNTENANTIKQIQMQADYEKKDAVAKEAQNKKDEITKTQLAQQAFQRNAFVVGFALMLIIAGVSYRNYRSKQKDNLIITKQKETVEHQKEVVENQKQLVEQKNKEITQSIEYALRIQSAILPSNRFVKEHLKNSFILYKPKDIVAGDFYWMEEINSKFQISNSAQQSEISNLKSEILLAACDCTGHGVPGAMVSVVCHNALNRAVREFGLTKPSDILDKTAEIVIENFSKSEDEIKDGMDVSLVSIKYNVQSTKIELEYAGANNALWIVRGNQQPTTSNQQLIETKPNKQPIGKYENNHPFTNHTFELNSGDTVYLFTDGFADQFGGESGEKKLTRKRFKDLLLSIQHLSMTEQGIALDKFITNYRNNVEQIDDILVMGVRV